VGAAGIGAYSVRNKRYPNKGVTRLSGGHKQNLSAGHKNRKEKTMKKRHGVFFGFAVLLITAIFTMAGCDNSGSGDADWLKDLKNPFVGKWNSDILNSQTNEPFVFNTDGTVSYKGTETGGYLVNGNHIVIYLVSKGLKAYSFTVSDNNTILVKEVEEVTEEEGMIISATSYTFNRDGEATVKHEQHTVLDTFFLGKWVTSGVFDFSTLFGEEAGTYNVSYATVYDFNTDGTFVYTGTYTPEPPSKELPPGAASELTGSGSFFVLGDKFIMFPLDSLDPFAIKKEENTVTVTDKDDISLIYVPFTE
jgi:hypothetical protein